MAKETFLKWLNDEEFVVAIDSQITPSSLRGELGAVPATYGGELADRILAAFFNGLVDLRREYATYYAKEYGTLREFLLRMYGLSDADIEALLRDPDQIVGWGTLTCGGDYNLSQWIEYSGGRPILERILHCAEKSDEDTN